MVEQKGWFEKFQEGFVKAIDKYSSYADTTVRVCRAWEAQYKQTSKRVDAYNAELEKADDPKLIEYLLGELEHENGRLYTIYRKIDWDALKRLDKEEEKRKAKEQKDKDRFTTTKYVGGSF